MSGIDIRSGSVSTPRGERLAKQLVSHWGRHALKVTTTGPRTVMEFPEERDLPAQNVTVVHSDHGLGLSVQGGDDVSRLALSRSLEEHLQRFAGDTEVLHFRWEQ